MADTSSRFGIVEPSVDRSDSADVPRDIRAVVAQLEALGAQYKQGAIGARPISTPGTPGKQGRFFMQTDVTPHILHYDFGTGWDPVGSMADGSVLTAMLADGSVTTIKLADGAVTTAKIADASVTASKVPDNTITAVKLVDAIVPSRGASGATEALRAIGTAAGTAAAGNDSRFKTIAVADTIANLNALFGGAPPNGAHGRLRIGAGPYDFVHLTYDQVMAKWVGIEKMGAWITFDTLTTSGLTRTDAAPWIPYKRFYDAGLRMQVNLLGSLGRSSAGGLPTLSIAANVYGTGVDTTHLTATVQPPTTAATGNYESGWVDLNTGIDNTMVWTQLALRSGGDMSNGAVWQAGTSASYRWVG